MSASVSFRQTFTKKNLKTLFYTSIRYKSAVGIDGISSKVFESQIIENIDIIYRKALNGTYNFSQYREKLIPKGANKLPRVISIPTTRDKLTLKALFDVLSSVYQNEAPFLHKIINDITTTIDSGKYDGVIRLDVKTFYPSIIHEKLFNQVKKKIRKKEIIHLIENAITQNTVSKPSKNSRNSNKIGVPQGLSISNILANIYFSQIDTKYSNISKIKYFRYVDDILILCNHSKCEKIKKSFSFDCSKLGLNIHTDDEEKSLVCKTTDSFSYLGYKFKNFEIKVKENSINNLHDSIIRIFSQFKYSKHKNLTLLEWSLNLRITGCIHEKTKYGWVFFFSQINNTEQLHSLDHFVKKQANRFGIDTSIIKIKKFSKTFHEITKNLTHSKYIENFDNYSLKNKKTTLRKVFGLTTSLMGKSKVEYEFNKRIFRSIKELERDLAKIS